jgi:hypothetical protein
MFYSETLLSKTGALARVWLSANLERKLSKSHILQSDIEGSVNAIMGQEQAPMALRLSAQLLLGVVRIYSRKARYLLDDCNEALMKLKMVPSLTRIGLGRLLTSLYRLSDLLTMTISRASPPSRRPQLPCQTRLLWTTSSIMPISTLVFSSYHKRLSMAYN